MCGTPSSRSAWVLLLLLLFMALVLARADEARPEPLPALSLSGMRLAEIATLLDELAGSLEDNSQRSEQESEALRHTLLLVQKELQKASEDLALSEASRIRVERLLEQCETLLDTFARQIRSLKLQRLGLICLAVLLTILAVVF